MPGVTLPLTLARGSGVGLSTGAELSTSSGACLNRRDSGGGKIWFFGGPVLGSRAPNPTELRDAASASCGHDLSTRA